MRSRLTPRLRDEGQTKIKTVLRRSYIFTPEVTSASGVPSSDRFTPAGRPSIAVLPFANMVATQRMTFLPMASLRT
jgi:hypothetical protein